MIVHTETDPATQSDYEVIPKILQDLANHKCLPSEHIVDAGYMNIHQVVVAENRHEVTTIGHPMPNAGWQAAEGKGFDLSHFSIDWDKQSITCPLQHTSRYWKSGLNDLGNPKVRVEFSSKDCSPCPERLACPRSKNNGRRITLHPQIEYEALQKLCRDVHTEEFKAKYRGRAGIEGTISQAVRACDLRHARYLGLTKVHLQHIATTTAINLARIFACFSGVRPA